jgi:mRNA interferase RelE/StbE
LYYNFKIAETARFEKSIKKIITGKEYQRIKQIVYPQLKRNPYFGPNIKKLKGELEGIYRFRIGVNRLFYSIDKDKIIVFILEYKKEKMLIRIK